MERILFPFHLCKDWTIQLEVATLPFVSARERASGEQIARGDQPQPVQCPRSGGYAAVVRVCNATFPRFPDLGKECPSANYRAQAV